MAKFIKLTKVGTQETICVNMDMIESMHGQYEQAPEPLRLSSGHPKGTCLYTRHEYTSYSVNETIDEILKLLKE